MLSSKLPDYIFSRLFSCQYVAVLFASSTAALLCSLAVSSFQQESVAVLWYDYGASKKQFFY